MIGHKTLLPPPSLGGLLAAGPVALFVDFDGTLVEIASAPDAIVVPSGMAADLEELGDRLLGRVALISGRALDDIERHLGPIELARAGSHGLHCIRADGSFASKVPFVLPLSAVTSLQDFAAANGLRYETKSHGGAVHYRQDPSAEDRVNEFAEQVAAEHGLSVKHGKAVAELVWPGASKQAAVRAFMQQPPFTGAMPIFIGDDVTDEDGFAGACEFGGFGVAVGERRSERARYHLDNVAAVHHWLEL